MSVAAFLLYMCYGRILLMVSTIYWLIFRSTKDKQMRFVCATVCMAMLASNLLNAGLSVIVLKVSPW